MEIYRETRDRISISFHVCNIHLDGSWNSKLLPSLARAYCVVNRGKHANQHDSGSMLPPSISSGEETSSSSSSSFSTTRPVHRCPTDSSRSPQLGAAGIGVRDPGVGQQGGPIDSRWPVRSVDVQNLERVHEQDAEDGVEGAQVRDWRFLRETRKRDH